MIERTFFILFKRTSPFKFKRFYGPFRGFQYTETIKNMKKKLLYLFALICSMSMFTACSDDDDKPNWKKLPTQEISAGNLALTTNTLPQVGASVKLAMVDEIMGC